MLVTHDRFAQGRQVRVRALVPIKVKGVSLAAGDTFDIEFGEANYLRTIGRVELVNPIVDEVPKKAAR